MVRCVARSVACSSFMVSYSSSAVFWFTIVCAPRSTLSARSLSEAARSVKPAFWEPRITRPRGSGSAALPGSSSIAASPTKPTDTTLAVASIRGWIFSGRLTDTSTLPTSTSWIFSTLPTPTPEMRTGELAFRLDAS